jgi:hypothetical protein
MQVQSRRMVDILAREDITVAPSSRRDAPLPRREVSGAALAAPALVDQCR